MGYKHGNGELTFPNGEVYSGQFYEGKINGHKISFNLLWII